jgi:hypothetical protein
MQLLSISHYASVATYCKLAHEKNVELFSDMISHVKNFFVCSDWYITQPRLVKSDASTQKEKSSKLLRNVGTYPSISRNVLLKFTAVNSSINPETKHYFFFKLGHIS